MESRLASRRLGRPAARLVLLAFDLTFGGALVALALTATATPAYAYVDPSVMTYTIQALAAVAVALSAVLGVAFRRTRKGLMKFLHIDEDASKVAEPDVHRIDPSEKARVDREAAEALKGMASTRQGQPADARPSLPWRRRFGLAVAASALLVFTVFVMAPLELVAANEGSLVFGLAQIWRPVALAGVVMTLVLALILSAVRGRAFDVLVALVAAGAVASYVQALALNVSLPIADGATVDWTQYHKVTLVSLLVWAGIIAGFVVLANKRQKVMRATVVAASVALIIVQSVGLVSVAATSAENAKSSVVVTEKGMFDVSGKKNVVVFVLDMTDSIAAKKIYAEHPEMIEDLKGFTWYQNTTGFMIPTRYGIPSLLTGRTLEPGKGFYDLYDHWYEGSHFLSDIADRGYDIGIYSGEAVFNPNSNATVEHYALNVEPLSTFFSDAVDYPNTLKVLYNAALYRDLPWIAKPFFWYYTDQINKGMILQPAEGAVTDGSTTPYTTDDPAYYEKLKQRGLTLNDEQTGSFRFIHLMGAHWPYTLDETGTYVESGTSESQQMRGAFRIVSEYLEDLRKLGLYDDTMVVITADHGFWNVPREPLDWPTSPILFVKPAQSAELDSQPCIISDKPVAQSDIHATILDAMGADQSVLDHYGEFNVPIQDRNDPYDRPRKYDATLSNGLHDTKIIRYNITGDVSNFDDWHLTGDEWQVLDAK